MDRPINLQTLLSDVVRMLPPQAKALKKLGIVTVADLLFHFPTRYGDTASKMNIGELEKGREAVIFGTISGLKTSKAYRKKIPLGEAWITDETGRIKVVWFHQAYLAKMIAEGALVRAEGKVSDRKGELYLSNPKIETVSKTPLAVGNNLFNDDGVPDHSLYPVYPESRGVTSNWIYHALQRVFKSGILDTLADPLPESILEKYNLPNLRTALIWIHTPRRVDDALAARKRFAFEEIFFIQLAKQRDRARFEHEAGFVIEPKKDDLDRFISAFPFPLTGAQRKSIDAILADLKRGHPMSRLLEGDVGSGKTAVAAAAVYAVTTTRPKGQDFGNLQTAYMVPTEILAKQHFESFIQYFRGSGIQIGLITGAGCRKFPSKVNPDGWTDISRTQLLKWVASGEIPILIGTHTLIQKSVTWKHLALAIIDEQHRFGVAQRAALAQKSGNPKEKSASKKTSLQSRKDDSLALAGIQPHLLSMTATPIPRTLALTLYGDLDLSLLDEMPKGRKQIITMIVSPSDRKATYEKIRAELAAGRQAYVICPRINEPDPDKEGAILAKSVTEEAKRLKQDIFPEYEIDILHSKMTATQKEEVMNEFKDGTIQILVATSVVEVGVNVPNATVIVIEGAERFGLAQLHQLRGRVIRSNHQAYCYVFTESQGEAASERLKALSKAANGFELAELDLAQRGAGALYSGKQWGVSDLAMEALRNLKMVEAARNEARAIIEDDPEIIRHPKLKAELDKQTERIHFE